MLPLKQRYKGFKKLLIKYHIALRSGWVPQKKDTTDKLTKKTPTVDCLFRFYQSKENENLSYHYLKDLRCFINRLAPLIQGEVTEVSFQNLVDENPQWSNTYFNKYRRYVSIIENGLREYGYSGSWSQKVKRRKQSEKLHKKIKNQLFQLNRLLVFNKDLHLCALLTYACLLRPHREVRELKWGDFNQELTQISLAGNRNKSKRNRVIPVPQYVRQYLSGGDPKNNIFTGTTAAYNQFYFSQLWTRFKAKYPKEIEDGQTLYSFRHTGAIAVYEKTKNIKILQTVMGHSDMAVSLTYLRGLEVNQIQVEDLPSL